MSQILVDIYTCHNFGSNKDNLTQDYMGFITTHHHISPPRGQFAWTNLLPGSIGCMSHLLHGETFLNFDIGFLSSLLQFAALVNLLCGIKCAVHLLCGVIFTAWWPFCTQTLMLGTYHHLLCGPINYMVQFSVWFFLLWGHLFPNHPRTWIAM